MILQVETGVKIFVYGTLKQGYGNHNLVRKNVVSVQNAAVRGKLYLFRSGYIPCLRIPEDDILGYGTTDYRTDAIRLKNLAEQFADFVPNPAEAIWGTVYGQLLTLDDSNLEDIDRLEGFDPGHRSLYRRVLAPIVTDTSCCPAWLYIAGEAVSAGRLIPSGLWDGELIPEKGE